MKHRLALTFLLKTTTYLHVEESLWSIDAPSSCHSAFKIRGIYSTNIYLLYIVTASINLQTQLTRGFLHTNCIVATRIGVCALPNDCFAPGTHETFYTITGVAVDGIMTGTTEITRTTLALIYVYFTMSSRITWIQKRRKLI